ncbi:hypothetical protein [Paludisphaera mucosa]|uniref:Uncharacterized protein n=1 Tax=Paludisphaera mucosa TaxID=3030827 RepID=A0ABT6FBE9_9BACT|nr:hypothetical protein [Paludisphaera mucosa]MDG3004866.1 hypothetical protein [Paludisphaera mucosa]
MISPNASDARMDLALPRILAAFLFLLAAVMGLPAAAVVLTGLVKGDWSVILVMTIVMPFVWMSAWLGRILWSGRPIPDWFVAATAFVVSLAPFGILLASGHAGFAGLLLVVASPMLLGIWSSWRGRRHDAASKPKPLDDFA